MIVNLSHFLRKRNPANWIGAKTLDFHVITIFLKQALYYLIFNYYTVNILILTTKKRII